MSTKPWYQRTYRRMLTDMHIPEWDDGFLAQYDPKKMAELYARAHAASVMFPSTIHGLSFYPTKVGEMHPRLGGRDILRELFDELRKRDIATVSYYYVIFNNWAFLRYPEWRMVFDPEHPDAAYVNSRYSAVCPNHPDYRAFARAQTIETAEAYPTDGLFIDMTFWPGVCQCIHCRARYQRETGKAIPQVVNWFDPDWCAFHDARERWIRDLAGELTQAVKAVAPQMSVYHNFAPALSSGWLCTCPLDSAVHHDFLGGDIYGGPSDQLVVFKTMMNLTENRPAEFMTSRCVNLQDHVRLKPFEQLEMHAYSATLFSSAFLFIDAIDPQGTANPAVYERIGKIFEQTAQYEAYLGGEPVEDVAIYFSNASKADFRENGTPLAETGFMGFRGDYPHMAALEGACRILQRAHIPFGVITRKQLQDLGRYRLVILPEVVRMDDEEAAAFREYVRGGGKLYASGYSSLVHSTGKKGPDYMLADVFGCHFDQETPGAVTYLNPRAPEIKEAVYPQDYVSILPSYSSLDVVRGRDIRAPGLFLREHCDGEVLATLTLPFACPKRGTIFNQDWASIHSTPPWEDTDRPFLVRQHFGEGDAIYSAAAIESVESEVNDRLVLQLWKSLIDKPLSYEAEAHPAVWMNVMHQPDANRCTVAFLNYQTTLPAIPIAGVPFTLRPPKGRRFAKLLRVPEETAVEFTIDASGAMHAAATDLDVFQMLIAELES